MIQNTISKDESFFQKISYFLSDTEYKNLTMDTRTFLYKETIDDMSLNKKMLLGKGPLGSYYSPFFGNLGFTDIYGSPDHYIRSSVEVGLLHMLLKGGLIYILLVTLFSSTYHYKNVIIIIANIYQLHVHYFFNFNYRKSSIF